MGSYLCPSVFICGRSNVDYSATSYSDRFKAGEEEKACFLMPIQSEGMGKIFRAAPLQSVERLAKTAGKKDLARRQRKQAFGREGLPLPGEKYFRK